MQKRLKYLVGALTVTALALVASAATPRSADAVTLCTQLGCTSSSQCSVDLCGGAGYCINRHCIPA
jgi:hypothetical protein